MASRNRRDGERMVTAVRPVRRAAPRVPAVRRPDRTGTRPVTGTALVAPAGAALPVRRPGLRTACTAVRALSVVLLVALLAARALHRPHHHRGQARAHLLDPATAPFHGCPAVALGPGRHPWRPGR
ncbi:hypothetical protein [Streptomyces cinereospinus]|uniref:Uncharacterized protein n=1 Tax=Streptomyces cinereospinus TaxID=285561 RepID=A0ABV5N005_9ACTN